jgi:hypothetical protein
MSLAPVTATPNRAEPRRTAPRRPAPLGVSAGSGGRRGPDMWTSGVLTCLACGKNFQADPSRRQVNKVSKLRDTKPAGDTRPAPLANGVVTGQRRATGVQNAVGHKELPDRVCPAVVNPPGDLDDQP